MLTGREVGDQISETQNRIERGEKVDFKPETVGKVLNRFLLLGWQIAAELDEIRFILRNKFHDTSAENTRHR